MKNFLNKLDFFSKPFVIFDAEANALRNPSKIHCVVAAVYEGKADCKPMVFTDEEEMKSFFKEDYIFVGHNITLWDIPTLVVDFLGLDWIDHVDTLILSWYLFDEFKRHGLDEWGKRVGVMKPKIDDWSNQTLEEYVHRCKEDVRINVKIFHMFITELMGIYKTPKKMNRVLNYLMFKLKCIRLQEKARWKLDVETTEANLYRFEQLKTPKLEALEAVMPHVPEYAKKNKPKNMYKKDGSYSTHGLKWLEMIEEHDLEQDHEEPIRYIRKYNPPSANSPQQIKKWLFELGWKPETFNYIKDGDEFRKVPQVYDSSKKVCPSIKDLYDQVPELENLEGLGVIKHRISTLKGFLKNVSDDGYVIAGVNGLTNTLRWKHKGVVNLPGVTSKNDERDGVWVRGCLIAPDDKHELCGSDMASLEDRTKKHYMWDYDPEYVKTMMDKDFDPHLDIAVVAHKMGVKSSSMSQEEADFFKDFKKKMKDDSFKPDPEDLKKYKQLNNVRGHAKQLNYSCVYGAGGASVARSLKIKKSEGTKLVNAYRERNWAVQAVAKDQKVIEVGDKTWLWNPVSRMYYRLRHDKDRFSTLNQGTGVFCFDMWTYNVLVKRPQLTGQFHDEIALTVLKGYREHCTKFLKDAIKKTNEQICLNIELDVDVSFGDTYADVH